MTLTDSDFEFVQTLVRSRAAIQLDNSKRYLVESRLAPIGKSNGTDVAGLLAEVRRSPKGTSADAVIDAMTTNETSWLRDGHPFEALKDIVVPQLAESGNGPITIWSAACSSGQEAYTVAMLISDNFPELVGRVRLTGTDLSTEMLEKAKAGRYTDHEVSRGLTEAMKMKHFRRDGDDWVLNSSIRTMVTWRKANLAEPIVGTGKFDIVMLRNVLIYFDFETKQQILDRIRAAISPTGYLLLGASESAIGLDKGWQRERVGSTTFLRPA